MAIKMISTTSATRSRCPRSINGCQTRKRPRCAIISPRAQKSSTPRIAATCRQTSMANISSAPLASRQVRRRIDYAVFHRSHPSGIVRAAVRVRINAIGTFHAKDRAVRPCVMTRVIAAIARTTLLEALRSRMLWLVGALILLVFGIASFLQQVALIEAAQVQGAIIAAVLRACAAFLVAAFVVMSMVREFNDKVLELMLAQPWPRAVYLLGKFAGFALSAVFLRRADRCPARRVRSRGARSGMVRFSRLRARDRCRDEPLLCDHAHARGPRARGRARVLCARSVDRSAANHRARLGSDPRHGPIGSRTGPCKGSPFFCRGSIR